MAKQQRVEADWHTIDPTTLPEMARKLYDASKEAYRVYKAERAAFEESMQAGVPEGFRMVFGYNFGKLSVAIVPDDRKPKAAKATTQSLADFLKAQASAGRRA